MSRLLPTHPGAAVSLTIPCIVICGVLFVPLAARADEAEERAEKVIKDLGGAVIRDDKQPGKPVVTVYVNSPINRSAMKHISAFKELRSLSVGGVTDDSIEEINSLKNLKSLTVGGGDDFTDEGLKHVAGHKNLTLLSL